MRESLHLPDEGLATEDRFFASGLAMEVLSVSDLPEEGMKGRNRLSPCIKVDQTPSKYPQKYVFMFYSFSVKQQACLTLSTHNTD